MPNGKSSNDGDLVYSDYWVSFDPKEDFEEYLCQSFTNIPLTTEFLYQSLRQTCLDNLAQNEFTSPDRFRKRIHFILKSFPEGNQTVWLEPYFLRVAGQFGFLADFKFQATTNSKATRRIQQLSLSLDKDNKSNQNFYADRFEKLQQFISQFYSRLFPIISDLLEISIQRNLLNLETKSLNPKRYVVADGKTSNSQFNGIKSSGPLRTVQDGVLVQRKLE